jgi:hypothetical protein
MWVSKNATIERQVGKGMASCCHLDLTATEGRDPAEPSERAGDRGRTGDVQLGKLFDEGPEDYDPWA